MTLLHDLGTAERKASSRRPLECPACALLRTSLQEEDERTYQALRDALAGSIGIATLVKILSKNGHSQVGRRTIEHHRREGHTQ